MLSLGLTYNHMKYISMLLSTTLKAVYKLHYNYYREFL